MDSSRAYTSDTTSVKSERQARDLVRAGLPLARPNGKPVLGAKVWEAFGFRQRQLRTVPQGSSVKSSEIIGRFRDVYLQVAFVASIVYAVFANFVGYSYTTDFALGYTENGKLTSNASMYNCLMLLAAQASSLAILTAFCGIVTMNSIFTEREYVDFLRNLRLWHLFLPMAFLYVSLMFGGVAVLYMEYYLLSGAHFFVVLVAAIVIGIPAQVGVTMQLQAMWIAVETSKQSESDAAIFMSQEQVEKHLKDYERNVGTELLDRDEYLEYLRIDHGKVEAARSRDGGKYDGIVARKVGHVTLERAKGAFNARVQEILAEEAAVMKRSNLFLREPEAEAPKPVFDPGADADAGSNSGRSTGSTAAVISRDI